MLIYGDARDCARERKMKVTRYIIVVALLFGGCVGAGLAPRYDTRHSVEVGAAVALGFTGACVFIVGLTEWIRSL